MLVFAFIFILLGKMFRSRLIVFLGVIFAMGEEIRMFTDPSQTLGVQEYISSAGSVTWITIPTNTMPVPIELTPLFVLIVGIIVMLKM